MAVKEIGRRKIGPYRVRWKCLGASRSAAGRSTPWDSYCCWKAAGVSERTGRRLPWGRCPAPERGYIHTLSSPPFLKATLGTKRMREKTVTTKF